MNPLVAEFLGAVLRWTLQGVFVFLAAQGIITPEQGEKMIVGLIGSLITLAWVLWVKYGQRLKILTSLAAPKGTTEKAVESMIKQGETPPATLRKTESPR
jgi:hypothetical protein